MSTNRPRENVYLSDEIAKQMDDYCKVNRISKSKLCRIVLEDFFNIINTPEYQAGFKFAIERKIPMTDVIVAALAKAIPEKYY